MDFAFFVANFHYSREEYNALTPTEKAFIFKAWEDKTVSDSTVLRDAVLNAVANALRKKNSRFKKLWRKLQGKSDREKAKEDIQIVNEIEKKEGKDWIDRIFSANGMKRKGGK